MSSEDRARWDDRYRSSPDDPDRSPRLPEVFAPFESLFPTTGHALELACGRGEATVWLAQRGLDALGVDVSPVAIAAARGLARRYDPAARARFEVVDLDEGLPPGPPLDVVLCHLFNDPRLDAAILERLAPDGLLALAALSEVGATPGRFRVRRGELEERFASLTVLARGEGDGQAWLIARATP